MDNLIKIGLGAGIGFALAFLFFKPDVVESIDTIETTDTLWLPSKEKIVFDTLAFESLEDSVDLYRRLYAKELKNIKIVKEGKPFSAPLRRYDGFKPTLYGNIGYNALVAGSLLEMNIRQDLRLPSITHRIETTKTRTRDLRGLYAGAGVSNLLDYKLGLSYVNKNWAFGVDWEGKTNTYWWSAKKRLF